jgi:hypothetical protein
MTCPRTKADLLDTINRVMPDSYLEPIRTVGPGYELYEGAAKVGERLSQAVSNWERDGFIMSSGDGARATVEAVFYRESATAGAGSVLPGTLVRASRGGQVFVVTGEAVFGALDLEVTAPAIANGFGYEWNVMGEFVDPDGVMWPGLIDTIDLPLQNPVFWDPTIQVRNVAPATGGRPATLEVLGAERGLQRHTGESAAGYRVRVRTLPDTITPAAIRRQLTNYFRRFPGLYWDVIETWEHRYQECYDAPDIGPTPTENYNANLFCYDDPRPPSPIANRWLGDNDHVGAFIVEVAMPGPIQEFSLAYDDPAGDAVGMPGSAPFRALSAYDAPDPLIAPAFAPAYDGVDVGLRSFFNALFALLEEIKAGGIFVVIHIQETA